MPRASRAQMAQNHETMVTQTSRLIREKGVDGVSVPEAMATAGLTRGGFYKHFSSKEALVAEATTAAFVARLVELTDAARDTDADAGRRRFIEHYLSAEHRDHPADGCGAVALASDAARTDPSGALRKAYIEGVRAMVEALARLEPATGAEDAPGGAGNPGDGAETMAGDVVGNVDEHAKPSQAAVRQALTDLSTMVGAVVLARATEGDEISQQILTSARELLLR